MKFDEFPFGPGLSLNEVMDASNECRHGRLPFDRTPPCGCWPCFEDEENDVDGEVKVYGLIAPFLGDVELRAWRIGPPGRWTVGDEVEIPERPPRFGQPRPGCPKARVTSVNHEDGVAEAVDVRLLDPRDDGTRWVPSRVLSSGVTKGHYKQAEEKLPL